MGLKRLDKWFFWWDWISVDGPGFALAKLRQDGQFWESGKRSRA
jgi:hypothetical protein